jgi:hypothetical protein
MIQHLSDKLKSGEAFTVTIYLGSIPNERRVGVVAVDAIGIVTEGGRCYPWANILHLFVEEG